MDSCMLFMWLPPSLEELSLQQLGIHDTFVKTCLIPGLRRASSLKSLRLDGNKIGQKGFSVLLEQLVENNATLLKLSMASNVNVLKGVRLPLPTEGLSRLGRLTALDLSNNLVNVTTFELPNSVSLLRLNNVSAVADMAEAGSQWLGLVDKIADMQRSGRVRVTTLGLAKNVFPGVALDRLMYRLSDFNSSLRVLHMAEVYTDAATTGELADVGWSLTKNTFSPTCLACLQWVTWDVEPWKQERLQLLYPRTAFFSGKCVSNEGLEHPFKYDSDIVKAPE
eukprot:SRR837773.9079.p1 GENE.SRR837773.9079~~SRR837773.9079.p1  ORF type:complete len:296 (-),score=69.45 SRR837773.9079:36-875(-)